MTLGRDNKFFLKFSKRIICYSNDLKNFPEKFKNKIKVINPLVFKDFYEIKKKDPNKTKIPVTLEAFKLKP